MVQEILALSTIDWKPANNDVTLSQFSTGKGRGANMNKSRADGAFVAVGI
jgi:hypothetical protein